MAACGKIEMIDIIDMSISDKSCHHIGNKDGCKFLIKHYKIVDFMPILLRGGCG